MKTFTLSLMAILFAVLSYGQGQNSPAAGTLPNSSNHASDLVISGNNGQLASIERSDYYSNYGAWVSRAAGTPEKCAKYKKFKIIGIVLSSVGGGMLIGGSVLANIGGDAYSGSYIHRNNIGMIAGGAVLVGLSLPCIGAGVTLAIIGSVKYKRYCKNVDRSYLQLHTGPNGLGLAMKF